MMWVTVIETKAFFIVLMEAFRIILLVRHLYICFALMSPVYPLSSCSI